MAHLHFFTEEKRMADVPAVHNGINRRAFIAGATVVGAAAMTGCATQPKGENHLAMESSKSSPVGISDAAYKKAWQRAAAMVAKMTLAEVREEFSIITDQIGLQVTGYSRSAPAYRHIERAGKHALKRATNNNQTR